MAARALRSPGLLMKCCEAVTGITEKLIKDNALVVGKAAMSDCNPPCSFTDSEIKFYYKQFIKYDKDRDGKLSRWELNELYREKYGRQMNATDLERMLMEMGAQYCDNTITFAQYMLVLQKRYAPRMCLQELMLVFDRWDKNNDGLLDWPEFRKAIGFIGYDPDHPDLLCRFQMSDRDVDDKVEFDEFVEAYEAMPCLPMRAC